MQFQKTFSPASLPVFKQKTLHWAQQFEQFTFLENNQISYPFEPFVQLLAVGAKVIVPFEEGQSFERLSAFHQKNKSWLFGCLSYELKDELEALHSQNPDGLEHPTIFFYEPLYLFFFGKEEVKMLSHLPLENLLEEIEHTALGVESQRTNKVHIQQKISKETYCHTVEQIQTHILNGDVYELNFCMEFFAKNAQIEPLSLFEKLNRASPMPFAVFQRLGTHYLLCASPERFLRKEKDKLLSQPIKGTIRRGKDAAEDSALKRELFYNEKERAENMMIVDLVRNDLARSAKIGSTKVAELFGIYTFEQLHQMISSVEASLHPDLTFIDALKNAFPMGSMTGAPKVMAMQLIEKYEQSKRGLYSGAVGYITPTGDFDFNVVIRSLIYNAQTQYLSFQVGSAITYDAIAEKEYEECLLKAKVMREVLVS